MKRLLSIICCLAVLCTLLTGCGSTDFGSLAYVEPEEDDIPGSFVAENSNFLLEFDDKNYGLILTDKNTGEVYKTTPEDPNGPEVNEDGLLVKKHPQVESILWFESMNFLSNNTDPDKFYSYTGVNDGYGKLTHEMTDNGIILNYFFSEAQVMIPLECILTEKGLTLKVDPNKIMENDNKVVSISVAPFFCGVKNDSADSYVFVPSGSGAIVDIGSKSVLGESYTAQVYGEDLAIDEVVLNSTREPVRLPVFGAKTMDKALCAIIDGSETSAKINATSGSTSYRYSSAYASFIVRGYTNHIAELYSYEKIERKVYAKPKINKPISISYYPLSGEKANYSGMADVYRDYLTDTFGMQEKAQDVALNLRVIGGIQTDESFLGIPYKTVYATSTVKDAEKMLSELKDKIGTNFTMQLKGFGDTGVDVGKIAGGYKVSGELGSFGDIENLFSLAKQNNIGLYFDFDMIRFNQNSSGISKFSDSVTNAGELKATQYYYDVAVRDKKLDTAYNLLSPSRFTEVYDKIAKQTGKYNLAGLSLDTLSSLAYSDYSDKTSADYYSKNAYAASASEVIKKVKEASKKYMATSANGYAAAFADIITESPISTDKNYSFLYEVPFYQMVFKGSVPITVSSINLTANPKETLLKAVESGSGLGYTVIDGWDSAILNSDNPYFYNAVYGDLKNEIYTNVKALTNYYNSISGQRITSHTVMENGLRETVFENGVTVYVNYTDKAISSPAGEVNAGDYLITEK